MKTVLVTGATGFIGGHLLPIVQQQGWEITAAIRNNFSKPASISIKTVKVGEIDGQTNWQEALQNINTVVHLAARAHIIQEEISNPEVEFLRINTEGTANLVKQSIKAGVRYFIFISSIGAMATLSNNLLTANSPCEPHTPYGRSKLAAEQALIDLAKDSTMTWTILRPTLVYGSGNPGNMERLMKLINLGLPLPFGSIKNRRSFIFVGNLTDAITTCLTNPQATNKIFLISDGEDLSTPNLVAKIAKQMNKPCDLLPVPPALLRLLGYCGDALQPFKPIPFNSTTIDRLLGSLFVDSSHIQNTLNWRPPFTMEQGLEKTIKPRLEEQKAKKTKGF